jgi:hypothetical protein
MQLSQVEAICNHMIGKTIISCEVDYGGSTIILQLDDDSYIEISGEELSIYGELTPLDD